VRHAHVATWQACTPLHLCQGPKFITRVVEYALAACDSGLILCLCTTCRQTFTLYLFLRTFSRAVTAPCGVTASRRPLFVGVCPGVCSSPVCSKPALCSWPHVKPSLLSLPLRRPVSSTRSDSTSHITGSGLANDSRSCTFSTRTRPCKGLPSVADIIIALIPTLAYEHRAARYPSHIHIGTTGTWSKYPGRPWRESFCRSPNGHHAPCTRDYLRRSSSPIDADNKMV
jgi:hypothetical protein